jgi:transposase-like protein
MPVAKPVYQATTREEAETALLKLGENWSSKYAVAVRSWENNWTELAAFFDFPFEIRRLIYTNNAIEGEGRQLRKVTKNKTVFPTEDAVRKSFYLAHRDIAAKSTMPIPQWPKILNNLVIFLIAVFASEPFTQHFLQSPSATNPLSSQRHTSAPTAVGLLADIKNGLHLFG